jgi:hypothetical protein
MTGQDDRGHTYFAGVLTYAGVNEKMAGCIGKPLECHDTRRRDCREAERRGRLPRRW